LTFYFVDPKNICNSRVVKRFQGTGDRLVLQNGSNQTDLIYFPLSEKDVRKPWIDGRCFYTMGKHYWYNISSDMDCDYFFPVFLMYNKGVLNAFGPDISAPIASPRWEHPSGSELDWFFNEDTVPQCLFNRSDLSTIHIYLTSAYWDFC